MTSPTRLVALAALTLFAPGCSDAPTPPKHVVLISIDTLRPDRLGAYGYRDDISPAFDALAREGVRFDQAVAASSWTLPSHASLFTSLWPSVLDLGRFNAPAPIADAAVTLTETLGDAGYRTMAAAAGGFVAEEFGFGQGFESFMPPMKRFEHAVDAALRWLDEGAAADDERPFFLFLHTYDVHNYLATDEDLARFVDPNLATFLAQKRNLGRFLQQNDADVCLRMSDRDWRYVSSRYDAAVATADRTLGRLIAGLAERGALEDTLVIVTSDHGEELGEHGRSGHGYTVHDENVLVPLVLRHPSLAPASVPAQVRLLDVAPTVVALLGLDRPPSWQGESLESLLGGDGPSRPAFAEQTHLPFKMLRTEGWKYILSAMQPHELLFDLRTDPHERDDLAADRPSITARHRDLMTRFVRRTTAETRYRGGVSRPSERALEELEQFGYLGGDGKKSGARGEEDDDRYPWIDLIRMLEREAAARED